MSHDERLKDIADRIRWLEDGAFRAMNEIVTDPVCGMAVERSTTTHDGQDGEVHYFCSPICRDEFVAAPTRFPVGRPR